MRESPTIAGRIAGTDDAVGRLEALFADAPVAFQVFGADGHCQHCNAAFRELFGSEPPPEYSVLEDDIAARQGVLELIHRGFAGEVIRVPPVWYDARDLRQVEAREGRRIAVEAVVLPLADGGGIVRHVAFIFTDRTAELQQREQTAALLRTLAGSSPPVPEGAISNEIAGDPGSAQRARDDLRLAIKCSPDGIAVSDRLASLGTLAAGAAHEINNPLASLVTNLDVAISALSAAGHGGDTATPAGDRTASVLDCLRDASEAADRIRQVVGDLRLFSRIDQERSGAVNLCAVLDSSVRMATTEIRYRARLVKAYESLPLVCGTEVRLGQVFLNLLINAAQAIPEGRVDEHEICVSARTQDAKHVVVEVRDTGMGIAPEIQARIFEPFFTTKAVGKGTGLGLAICQKIVTEYGGHIDVESEAGRGSVFRVILRRWHEGPQPAASPH